MFWEKLGKIFDPTEHVLGNSCQSYAQAPQVLVFKDFVRIYFSTRSCDVTNGMFLSHIAFVDMDKNFETVLKVSQHDVIRLGEIGCFDEHGIFPLHVLRHEEKIIAYIGGVNRRQSVPVDSAIGFAVSDDHGESFRRIGAGPVLGASLREPCLIADPFVRFYNGQFYMWYIFGCGWRQYELSGKLSQERVYKIAQATSPDGLKWVKNDGHEIVPSIIGPNECQALPTVIFVNDLYHMFFCYRYPDDFRSNPERAYRIGYAWSKNLVTWNRNDEAGALPMSKEGWDSEMNCYPHVFSIGKQVFMLYNGNEFGKYGFGLAKLHF